MASQNLDQHCSGLVKLTANKSELFVSQVSWSEYVSMLRVYKQYNLPFASVESPYVRCFTMLLP